MVRLQREGVTELFRGIVGGSRKRSVDPLRQVGSRPGEGTTRPDTRVVGRLGQGTTRPDRRVGGLEGGITRSVRRLGARRARGRGHQEIGETSDCARE